MNRDTVTDKRCTHLVNHREGQGLVEFALILPLLVLFIIGIFELGRAFFAYIAITNASREGARVVTFWPRKATEIDVVRAVIDEIGTSPMVTEQNINEILINCGDLYNSVPLQIALDDCPTYEPVRVTVTYNFELILSILHDQPIVLRRSTEMMMP